MQEEVNEKTVALAKNTAKMTGRVLAGLMRRYLASRRQKQHSKQSADPGIKRGKTTLKELQAHGESLSTIEITDQNIKSFERVAKRYGITFSLKKDATQTPPKYVVFFRGRDVDVITQAFKEYTALEKARANPKRKKPSIRKRLEVARQRAKEAPAQQKEKVRAKEAEQAR